MPNLNRIPFIAFEGIDGAGKFTQINKVFEWLEDQGFLVSFFSEPNDQSSLVGKHIRSILRKETPPPSNPLEFQRLYVIDRTQNLVCFVIPNIKIGRITLIERHALSTLAYGMLSSISVETLIQLHMEIAGSFMVWPDVHYVLDITADEAIRRIGHRGEGPAQFFEKRDKLSVIRDNYKKLASVTGIGEVVIIDGMRSEEEVFEDIKADISQRFFGD